MIDINRFEELMEQVVAKLPPKVFERLNLGVGLVEGAKSHNRTASGQPVHVLGEYHVRRSLGRGIILYYQSFCMVYPNLSNESEAMELIESVIKHELVHHLESLAGENDLALEDERRLQDL